MSLHIQFLGQTRLRRDGILIDLAGHRPLALLAYLIVTKKAHSRQHLIDLLFDGPEDPRAALRWTLSKIRKAIGGQYLLANREEISFNFESDYWVDLAEFEAGELELYRGEFLEGLYLRDALRFEDWLGFERGRLRGMYEAGLEKQLEEHRRLGDAAVVVITAQQLLKLDNLREDWHYALMEAYARLGKRSTALEQFEQCRQVLRAEWDMEPRLETVALAGAIRSGQIGLGVPTRDFEIGRPGAATAAVEPAAEPAEKTDNRHRTGLSWPAAALLGALGLVALILLVLSRVFDVSGQSTLNQGRWFSTTYNTNPPGANSQPFAGKKVLIIGPYFSELADLFVQSMTPFEEQTGIDVVFVSSSEDYSDKRLQEGNVPDIIIFPQPGRLFEFAKEGKVIDLKTFLDEDYLQQQYPEKFLALGTLDDKLVGVWFNVGLKSLVWYPKRAFEAKGYKSPETWDELIALSDRIVADGGTPWCIGINDYDFKGWLGTDWVEDILLRTAPPETYDAWVRHDLPFNSPEIRRAYEIMGQIWLNDDYVYGGVAQINVDSLADSPTHLFENPPGCFLLKQASFAPLFFPPEVNYGQDYDFFYLPPIDPEFGKPVLGSGEIFAMFNDRPEVREVMRYLTTAESAKVMIQHGNFLSPHKNTPLEWFPTPADLRFAQIVLSADTYRFDGSDMMPGEVGLGSFLRGITDWVSGADLDTVLQEIDSSWPR